MIIKFKDDKIFINEKPYIISRKCKIHTYQVSKYVYKISLEDEGKFIFFLDEEVDELTENLRKYFNKENPKDITITEPKELKQNSIRKTFTKNCGEQF